jgi:hypothetical protein
MAVEQVHPIDSKSINQISKQAHSKAESMVVMIIKKQKQIMIRVIMVLVRIVEYQEVAFVCAFLLVVTVFCLLPFQFFPGWFGPYC